MSINYYDSNAKDFFDSTVNSDMSNAYKPFMELLPPSAKILDIGCGSGRDSLFFINSGFEVTAIDASAQLVSLASALINRPVLLMRFQDISFYNEYDAVWACASLLHVPRSEIDEVLLKIKNALKHNGIFYNSFKYGDKEEYLNGRYFNFYDEQSYLKLLQRHPDFEIIKMWKAADVRPGREDEYWLNCIIKVTKD